MDAPITAPVATPAVAPTASSPAQPAAPAASKTAAPVAQVDAKGTPQRGPDGKFQATNGAAKAADSKEAATKAADSKEDAPKAAPKPKYKLKVDGQEEEHDIDEIIRRAQLSTAAEKRFREATEGRKALDADRAKFTQEAEERDNRIKTVFRAMEEDPEGFAREAEKYGLNSKKFAQQLLRKDIEAQLAAEEEKTLSPEQRELRETKRRLAEYEAAEQKRTAEAKKAEEDAKAAEARKVEDEKAVAHRAEVDKLTNDYGSTIQAALEKTALPKTPELALQMLDVIDETVQRGLPVTPEHIASRMEQIKLDELNALLSRTDDASLLKLLPKDVQSRLNKASIEEFKKNNPMAAAKPVTGPQAKEPEKTKRMWGGSLNARVAKMGFELMNGGDKK